MFMIRDEDAYQTNEERTIISKKKSNEQLIPKEKK